MDLQKCSFLKYSLLKLLVIIVTRAIDYTYRLYIMFERTYF